MLSPGCSTLTVDFGALDAGSDGRAGAAAASRRAAAPRGAGGRRRAGGGGAARGGSGGGATGGSGGAAGSRGTGGSGGAAGPRAGRAARRARRPGPENCFDGIDNDCNGLIDCADPACGATVAQCVALDPTAAPIGLLSGVGTGRLRDGSLRPGDRHLRQPQPAQLHDRLIAGQGCNCAAGSSRPARRRSPGSRPWPSAPATRRAERRPARSSPARTRPARAGVPPGRWTPHGDIYRHRRHDVRRHGRRPACRPARRTSRRTASGPARPSAGRRRWAAVAAPARSASRRPERGASASCSTERRRPARGRPRRALVHGRLRDRHLRCLHLRDAGRRQLRRCDAADCSGVSRCRAIAARASARASPGRPSSSPGRPRPGPARR